MKKTTYYESFGAYEISIDEVIALLIEHKNKGATHVTASGGYDDICQIGCYTEIEMTAEEIEKESKGRIRNVTLIYQQRQSNDSTVL